MKSLYVLYGKLHWLFTSTRNITAARNYHISATSTGGGGHLLARLIMLAELHYNHIACLGRHACCPLWCIILSRVHP